MAIEFLKIFAVWCLMALLAILNGLLRDKVLVKWLGDTIALPLSGIILSILVFTIVYFLIELFKTKSVWGYLLIGLSWVFMTIAFEYIFGHWVMGKTWGQIHRVFDPSQGDLLILVLLVTLLSPWLAAIMKQLL